MIEIIEADLNLPAHAAAMVQLMDTYALDPMGGGQGLSDFVKANLPSELTKRKSAHVILAFVEGEPAGLVIGLEGFSTFACQPLLNIHDVIVALPYRGRGLSKLLLQKAEAIALNLGCCKLISLQLRSHPLSKFPQSSIFFLVKKRTTNPVIVPNIAVPGLMRYRYLGHRSA